MSQREENTESPSHDNDRLRNFGDETSSSQPNTQDLVVHQNAILDDHTIFCTIFLHNIRDSTPAWKRNLYLTCESYVQSDIIMGT